MLSTVVLHACLKDSCFNGFFSDDVLHVMALTIFRTQGGNGLPGHALAPNSLKRPRPDEDESDAQ
jgi:hypothetical protein